jgi:hypothetical protein
LIEELKELGAGVDNVRNSYTNLLFTLRAFVIVVSGDGPASAEAMGLKKPGNAYRPCHQCLITATAGSTGKTLYIPHTDVDISNLPLRTHMRQIIHLFAGITDPVLQAAKGKDLGIVRASILLRLPTLRFPESFPLDIMHSILQNVTPMIHTLMGGRKKIEDTRESLSKRQYRKRLEKDLGLEAIALLDEREVESDLITPLDCLITDRQWSEIGGWQDQSRKTIPTLMGQAPRPIHTRYRGYKAMEWEAFLVRDGIPLMSHLGAAFRPYLMNFHLLREIYLTAISRELTTEDLRVLRRNCINWVREFESLYYSNNLERMKYCKINGHSLLHLGTCYHLNTRNANPSL